MVLPIGALPAEVAEGDVVRVDRRDTEVLVIAIDAAATAARREQAQDRLATLRRTRSRGRFDRD